jgi:integrase
MALTTNGRRRIQFTDRDGIRRSIELSGFSKSQAKSAEHHVKHLVASQTGGVPLDMGTARWLAGLGDKLYARFVAVGLCPPRATQTVEGFVDEYIHARKRKPKTVTNLLTATGHLLGFLKDNFPLRAVTRDHARDYYTWLKERFALNTSRTYLHVARQVFDEASRRDLIDKNPFAGIECESEVRRDRQFFVSRETVEQVLRVATDDWPLIITLCRYAGLRRNEPFGITWEGINWENLHMWVPSPKTEHHKGKEGRWVPLFPEVY